MNMKRYVTTLLLAVLTMGMALADAVKIYTPADVPNVQKEDITQFVSDPAHFMSDDARSKANARLCELRDSTTAEVAVVILPSIGDADIFNFSQQLATKWGIGKADKDNGMLVLFDMDGHQVRVHPGPGTGGDIHRRACRRLINEVIVPPLKTGDINDAVLDLSDKLYQVMTDPEAAAEIRSPKGNEGPRSPINLWYIMLVPIIATGAVYTALCKRLWHLRGKSDYEKARELHDGTSTVMDVVLCVLTLGLGIPAVLIRMWAARHYRDKSRKCDVCGTRMEKLPEDEDNKYLSEAQDMEEKLRSVDYDVWLCPKCGATEVFPFPELNTGYSDCPYCHTKAMHLLYNTVQRPATATRKGVGVKVYECRHCGKRLSRPYELPIAAGAAPIIIGGIGGRGGGGGFNGPTGGGFGGGSFGGGGSTGSW